MAAAVASHAELMNGVYRRQRHIYDLSRKYYLLGRDRLIAGLDAKDGGSVLEIGCGTGRNLIAAAEAFPLARLFGLDISSVMLDTAAKQIAAEHLHDQIKLAQGDATGFDAEALFGQSRFDRIFLSYAVSMIPGWEKALEQAAGMLTLGGSLHIVDFGQQEDLPRWFRSGLRAWLLRFHVEPRPMLAAELAAQAERIGGRMTCTALYRGYAWHAVLTRPATMRATAYSLAPVEKCAESAATIA